MKLSSTVGASGVVTKASRGTGGGTSASTGGRGGKAWGVSLARGSVVQPAARSARRTKARTAAPA
jgi:hypothetical protein